jgi:hypothetical protein
VLSGALVCTDMHLYSCVAYYRIFEKVDVKSNNNLGMAGALMTSGFSSIASPESWSFHSHIFCLQGVEGHGSTSVLAAPSCFSALDRQEW